MTFDELYVRAMTERGVYKKIGRVIFDAHDTHGLSIDVATKLAEVVLDKHYRETKKYILLRYEKEKKPQGSPTA